jgi:hypothetical protein
MIMAFQSVGVKLDCTMAFQSVDAWRRVELYDDGLPVRRTQKISGNRALIEIS